MSSNNNNGSYSSVTDTVKVKPARKLNYQYLQVLAAVPIMGAVKFIGRDKYPRLNWALYGLTIAGAFVHGSYMLTKSYGTFDDD
ncbi:hypothetical protein DFA_05216 [Cavenderia fasciculata]|uniref:Transmembrane protein n=1 Tax=Cavenderia fasciculata TaxID=261658 RepID=F4PNN3_CACFS|nr:uncharacterized protein DFA_05216 [Cavenderia fasciculata]EGG23086.1 hypothetical protein DFA_05216 [Cavenderia fasciculata]|eukprot:XP_004360937.1 hypothetical protein DFA_05216 [Cavenderia fasciculata]